MADGALRTEAAVGMELMTLPRIFDGFRFAVPDYQRGYAWDKEQVEDLLRDVEHLRDAASPLRHYTGTLVLTASGGAVFDIVDGQQRLTTIVILMAMLAPRLPPAEGTRLSERYVWRGAAGNRQTVLQLAADARAYFERVVLGDGDDGRLPSTLDCHRHLLDARKTIVNWIAAKREDELPGIVDVIERALGFLVYSPANDAEIGIMFEVINNRGKKLSDLERVKNYLIYCCAKLGAEQTRRSINVSWATILGHLNQAKVHGAQAEGAFLRYSAVVHFGLSKSASQDVYAELRKRLAVLDLLRDPAAAVANIERFVAFLEDSALWHARLYGRHHAGQSRAMATMLDQLRAQNRHASIMPLFLALVIKLKDERRLLHLLSLLEKLNFRVYIAVGMMARNDSGQALLYQYAANFYAGTQIDKDSGAAFVKTALSDRTDELEYWLVYFTLVEAPEEQFRDSFDLSRSNFADYYDWEGLRYFLMSYEAELQPRKTIEIDKILRTRAERKSNDYYSVEHLWAVAHRNGEGENVRASDLLEKRRLGNFVLLELGINIQGGNLGIEDKIKRYLGQDGEDEATDLSHVRKMAKNAAAVLQEMRFDTRSKNYYRDRHKRLNDLQEERYMDFAVKRWSVKEFLGFKEIKRYLSIESEEAER